MADGDADPDDRAGFDLEPLVAEAWYSHEPGLGNPLLVEILGRELKHVEARDGRIQVTHESCFYATPDGSPGWATTVVEPAPLEGAPDLTHAVWPGAAAAIAGATHVLTVREEIGGLVQGENRVAAFDQVLRALVAASAPDALVWPATQTVTDPAGHAGELVSLDGVLNLRTTSSPEAADGVVLDTLGLAAFDLPDVECHARGIDVDAVGAHLVRLAAGMALAGEYVADGDPVVIQTAQGELWCTARYSVATVPPERNVLALIADAPYGLGSAPERPDED